MTKDKKKVYLSGMNFFAANAMHATPPHPMSDPLLERPLTNAEKRYVLDHLAEHIVTSVDIESIADLPSSRNALRTDFTVGGIHILFPMSDSRAPYEIRNGRVVFLHDFVKSAFYLLSAYQEWADPDRDTWGRYSYDSSIQKKTGTVQKPLVNYYFRWLCDGIALQCDMSGIQYTRLSFRPRLHLTHDIDLAHYYTWHKTLFRCAQVVGARPCDAGRWRLAKAALRSAAHIVGLHRGRDPYWSFYTIMDNEAFMGYKSHWFFLTNDGGPFGPDYDISSDNDIRQMIDLLQKQGNRIGLHAPINCRSKDSYAASLKQISDVVGNPVCTIRQHFLAIDTASSLRAMDEAGAAADCSVGFSTHEGFRTSYCMPYHPFDHTAQRTLNITEIPLALMDTTVLSHRRLSFDEIFLSVGDLLDEVRLFGGVMSILWHNSTFDETYHPGIGRFYEDLHLMFSQYQLDSYLLDD